MRLLPLITLTLVLCPVALPAQHLNAADKVSVAELRARYYNLLGSGFASMNCSVNFDFATLPLLSPDPLDPVRTLVLHTGVTLALNNRGVPNVQLHYPDNANPADIKDAAQITGLMRAFVGGLFQTWPTKGLQGPIPAFDSEIASLVPTSTGRTLTLRVPGGSAQVLLDKDDNVTTILSDGGKLQEHPTYSPEPEGLVFTALRAINDSGPQRSVIQYELTNRVIDGLRVPAAAHLKVDDNIDVRYTLEACSVKKGLTIHVSPPEAK